METKSDLKNTSQRGVIYLGHIPHGFYEEEIRDYFKQFGKVTNLRVSRSRKSGRSKGFGFVEFANNEVAKIAAETMNNYLMFKKRVIAQYVPPERRHPRLFANRVQWSTSNYPLKGRHRAVVKRHNTDLDDKEHLKQTGRLMKTVRRTLKKLADMGIIYDFQPVDKPTEKMDAIVTEASTKPDDTLKLKKQAKKNSIPTKTSPKPTNVLNLKKKGDTRTESSPKSADVLKSKKAKKDIVSKSLGLKDSRVNVLIDNVRKHLGKTGCINDNIITRSKSKVGK